MKKLAAIFFFLLFLFNLVGYRLWFNYAQQQSDIQLAASLDKHQYNDAELISIKVPLSMPYQTAQSNYERVDGEIKINGKIYKYVKRRVVNGELELLCLPDQNKMRLQSAKNDYFKTTADITNDSGKKSDNSKTNAFKNLTSDYEQQVAVYTLSTIAAAKKSYSTIIIFSLSSTPHTPPGQPPDAA